MSERIAQAQVSPAADVRPTAARDNGGQLGPDGRPKGWEQGPKLAGFASELVEVATASNDARPARTDLPAAVGSTVPLAAVRGAPSHGQNARSVARDAPNVEGARPRAQSTEGEIRGLHSATKPAGNNGPPSPGDQQALPPSVPNGTGVAQEGPGEVKDRVAPSIETLSGENSGEDNASSTGGDSGGGVRSEILRDRAGLDAASFVTPAATRSALPVTASRLLPAPAVPAHSILPPSVVAPSAPAEVLPTLSQRLQGSRTALQPLAARLTKTAPVIAADSSGGSQKLVPQAPTRNAPAISNALPRIASIVQEGLRSGMSLQSIDSSSLQSGMALLEMPASVASASKPAEVAINVLGQSGMLQSGPRQPGGLQSGLLPSTKLSVTAQETHFAPAIDRALLLQKARAEQPLLPPQQHVTPRRAADSQQNSARQTTPGQQPAPAASLIPGQHQDVTALRASDRQQTSARPLTAAQQPAPATQFAIAEQLAPMVQGVSPIEQISDSLRTDLGAARNTRIVTDSVEGTRQRSPVRVLQIQLQPADLGTVTVRISLKENMLRLNFDASQHEMIRLIEQNRTAMVQALRREGFSIDLFGVQISQSGGLQLSTTAQPASINGAAASEQLGLSSDPQSGGADGEQSNGDTGHKGDTRRPGESVAMGGGEGVVAQEAATSDGVYI